MPQQKHKLSSPSFPEGPWSKRMKSYDESKEIKRIHQVYKELLARKDATIKSLKEENHMLTKVAFEKHEEKIRQKDVKKALNN